MAKTYSKMIPLETKAHSFELWEPLTNKKRSLDNLKGSHGTLIMFICNHCPFVIHLRKNIVELANKYQSKGISFIAINSNDAQEYPEDSSEKMVEYCEKYHYPFSYLFDETQDVAKKYEATCTPDFFLYDDQLELYYRGRFDESTPGNSIEITGKDIILAMNSLLENKTLNIDQQPSIGCNIKWKH